MAEITFEITKELGVISENAKGWTRELNLGHHRTNPIDWKM